MRISIFQAKIGQLEVESPRLTHQVGNYDEQRENLVSMEQ